MLFGIKLQNSEITLTRVATRSISFTLENLLTKSGAGLYAGWYTPYVKLQNPLSIIILRSLLNRLFLASCYVCQLLLHPGTLSVLSDVAPFYCIDL